jgi:hypothetical protein
MRHNKRNTVKNYMSIQEQLLKPVKEIHRNKTDSITYLDFYSSVTTKINLTRQMKMMTNYGKCELYLTSSLMHMLNITAQKDISAIQTPVVFRSKNPKSWGKNLQALQLYRTYVKYDCVVR